MTRKERILAFCLIAETIIIFLTAFVLWVRTTIEPPNPFVMEFTAEEWMEMVKQRQHQPVAIWEGISTGSISTKSTGCGMGGLELRDTPSHVLERHIRNWRIFEMDPLMFLPLFNSEDPQVVLTGIYVYRNLFPDEIRAQYSTEISAAFRKLLDHRDSRIRVTAIGTLGKYRWLTVEDVERGLNDRILNVAWSTAARSHRLLNYEPHYSTEDELINGDTDGVEQLLDTKRRLAPILLEHLNHTHFNIRNLLALNFRYMFKKPVRTESGGIRYVPAPTLPEKLDWVRADWHTREQTKLQWQRWWAEHGEEALRFAHPPQ